MATVLPFPLGKIRAQTILRGLRSGRVFFTRHAEERMVERGISRPDVLDCLASGFAIEEPAQMPKGSWRIRLAWFRAGKRISVVTELDEDANGEFAVVVTVIN
jgi:hypothetical protein